MTYIPGNACLIYGNSSILLFIYDLILFVSYINIINSYFPI